eukprot:TRINITY_DN697_c0_g2_i2.p1 TRINITY_DN697_c0_g2~~TRINITY_DN697_c0_g2_i2.p1  ORF type:complete len:514 (-),score=132.79 TRINITY_DN697_c0_g2_i2:155-1696(-)
MDSKGLPRPPSVVDITHGMATAGFSDSGPPEIDPSEVVYNEVRDFLGQGSFGKVYAGTCRGKKVAVKVPLKQDLDEKQLEDLRREVEIMRKIFHPNCVLFMGACSKKGNIKIITELLHTDMEKLLSGKRELSLYQRMKMAKDAALGMNWIHGITNIIHHDLKPANLLVDSNLTVKVTDYGFSQLKEAPEMRSKVAKGTPLWMSPEIMLGKPFNEKCDVYSFGIILWQMLTRKEPFSNHTSFQEFRRAVCRDNERPPIPDGTLPGLDRLIRRCWDAEPKVRPSFKEIIYALDEILVDLSLTDPDINKFWKDNFLVPKQELQESVPWNDFVQRLFTVLVANVPAEQRPANMKPELLKRKELETLLTTKSVDESKSMVTMQKFSDVVKWFGPFYKPGELAWRILAEIPMIVSQPWYHGDITRDEADKRLKGRPEGTFLVRCSATDPEFPFTLSTINSQHRRVRHRPGGEYSFKATSKQFKTLVELIEKCDDPIIAAQLKEPCPTDYATPASWGYTY